LRRSPGCDPTPVREPIQFSEPDKSADLFSPPPKENEDAPSRPFGLLNHGSSVDGAVAPFMAPSSGVVPNNSRTTRLLLEAFDRRKNWIYVQSEDQKTPENSDSLFLGGASGGFDRPPKTALENFLENRGGKRSGDHGREAGNDLLDAKKDAGAGFDLNNGVGINPVSRNVGSYESGRALTAGFSLPLDFFGGSKGQGSQNDFRNTRWNDSLSSTQRQDEKDTVRNLLSIPGSVNPLASGFNLQAESVPQELNSSAGPRANELTPAGVDALNPLRSVGPNGNSSGLLDDPGAKILGQGSLSPAVSAPSASSRAQPKPITLELPHRRF